MSSLVSLLLTLRRTVIHGQWSNTPAGVGLTPAVFLNASAPERSDVPVSWNHTGVDCGISSLSGLQNDLFQVSNQSFRYWIVFQFICHTALLHWFDCSFSTATISTAAKNHRELVSFQTARTSRSLKNLMDILVKNASWPVYQLEFLTQLLWRLIIIFNHYPIPSGFAGSWNNLVVITQFTNMTSNSFAADI